MNKASPILRYTAGMRGTSTKVVSGMIVLALVIGVLLPPAAFADHDGGTNNPNASTTHGFPHNLPSDFNTGSNKPDVLDIASAAFYALLQGFGGKITDIDYLSCSCGAIVLEVDDKRTGFTIKVIYFYALDILKRFGVIPDDFPTPTLYMFYNIFTPNVEGLGNYFPFAGAPCLEIVAYPPYCSIAYPGAVGYIYHIGTTLLPVP